MPPIDPAFQSRMESLMMAYMAAHPTYTEGQIKMFFSLDHPEIQTQPGVTDHVAFIGSLYTSVRPQYEIAVREGRFAAPGAGAPPAAVTLHGPTPTPAKTPRAGRVGRASTGGHRSEELALTRLSNNLVGPARDTVASGLGVERGDVVGRVEITFSVVNGRMTNVAVSSPTIGTDGLHALRQSLEGRAVPEGVTGSPKFSFNFVRQTS